MGKAQRRFGQAEHQAARTVRLGAMGKVQVVDNDDIALGVMAGRLGAIGVSRDFRMLAQLLLKARQRAYFFWLAEFVRQLSGPLVMCFASAC